MPPTTTMVTTSAATTSSQLAIATGRGKELRELPRSAMSKDAPFAMARSSAVFPGGAQERLGKRIAC
jgi:hypothetical protein